MAREVFIVNNSCENNNKIKPSFDENRSILGKLFPLRTPFTVILDSSEICNFKCNYCFRSDSNKKAWGYAISNDLMSDDIFYKAVEQIQKFPDDLKQISLSHQGEPLFNKKIPERVRYIKGKRIKGRVSIHTNGSLLTPDYAVDLVESGIDRIIISLQGITQKKYKDTCDYNMDMEFFYDTLKLMYERKKNTQICIKVMDIALDDGEAEYFYEKYAEVADRVFIEHAIQIWEEKDYSKVSKSYGLQNIDKMSTNKYGNNFPTQYCCPIIFNTIVVLPNGDVYPCTQLLTPYKLGNINEESLEQLWNGDKRKKLLIDQCKQNLPDVCKVCGIRQNSIYSEEDMIDNYRMDILERLEKK